MDAPPPPPHKKTSKKKNKEVKDRWARTEDAYSYTNESSSKRKKSKKSRRSSGLDNDRYSRQSNSTSEFPEDAEGGLYGDGTRSGGAPQANGESGDDIFNHQL